MSSAAEIALKKKYALLQKRKEAAAKGTGGAASGTAGASRPAATPQAAAPAQDAARLAAIRALQAKRAEGGAAAGSGSGSAPAVSGAAGGSAAGSKAGGTKLKLVIPKREVPAAGAGKPLQQQTAQPPAPTDPGRAAALAALRAKAAQQAAVGVGVASTSDTSAAAGAQQAQQPAAPKRPTMKRPSARPRPLPQQQLQAAAGSAGAAAAAALDGTFGVEAAQLQQQHLEQFAGGYGFGGVDLEGDQDREAKRQRVESDSGHGATLFVGDLPQYWATADLYDFFHREFGNALEARVIGSQCYGFVTFATPEDAEGVLEFAQQQGVWADDRMLRINWAQGTMPDWKKGPAVYRSMDPDGAGAEAAAPVLEAYEHPRVKEARLQAQQLAASVDAKQIQQLAMEPPPQRQLVSYEDL